MSVDAAVTAGRSWRRARQMLETLGEPEMAAGMKNPQLTRSRLFFLKNGLSSHFGEDILDGFFVGETWVIDIATVDCWFGR